MIVGWYPNWWRDRYGTELLEVLDQHDASVRTVGNLFVHAVLTRATPRPHGQGGFAMPRLRPRLVALVAAFPLFLVAFAGWFTADEPVDSHAIVASAGLPAWRVAEEVMSVCVQAMAIALILGAAVVAIQRARSRKPMRAIGYGLAGLVILGGPAVFLAAFASHPNTPPAHPEFYLLALVVGALVAIGVLAVGALRARSDRRTAALVAGPATVLAIVLSATFAALVGYAADMFVHGVPLITAGTPGVEHTASVHVYPVDALPAEYHGWLSSLIVALLASLAALAAAAYAVLGMMRGVRTAASSG
jgi:hypothetical protein